MYMYIHLYHDTCNLLINVICICIHRTQNKYRHIVESSTVMSSLDADAATAATATPQSPIY